VVGALSTVPEADPPPLPDDVAAVAASLRAGLERAVGDALASLFIYGAIAFPRTLTWMIDFDFHVLLHRPLTDAELVAIDDLHRALAAETALGADLDGYYVLLADAPHREPPANETNRSQRDEAWALHRAHVHAGRYLVVCGLDPRPIVPEPTWAELDAALRAELDFVQRHPEATAFGILNGARILASYDTSNVVMSKYQAAQWALGALPDEWHSTVRAAVRTYERAPREPDAAALRERWPAFVAYVRASIPAR